ncbi:MAG TPA: hypothetical protein VK927_07750, partial [Adhaeribacter sp.]|nr:hypothetical protein [Adhaeribacter sp.]
MKHLFAFAFLFFTLNLHLTAQSLDLTGAMPEADKTAVETECRRLKASLNLDDDQYLKLLDIKTEWGKNLQVVNMLYTMEPEVREKKVMELAVQYDGEFARILTDHQFNKYLELQGRPMTEEVEEAEQNEEMLAETTPKPDAPTFNDKIQEILKLATTPKVDSASIRLAMLDSLAADSVQITLREVREDSVRMALIELEGLDTMKIASADVPDILPGESGFSISEEDDALLVLPESLTGADDNISLLNSGEYQENKIAGGEQPQQLSDPLEPNILEPATENGSEMQEKSIAAEPAPAGQPVLPEAVPELDPAPA